MNCQADICSIKSISEVLNMVRIKLEQLLESTGVSRYELAKRTGIQYQIIDNYYKNRIKRYDSYVLDRICIALSCDISDIIEYIK